MGQVPQAHQAPCLVTSWLEDPFAKWVKLGAPCLPVPPSLRPPTSCLIISIVPGSQGERNPCLGSLCPMPIASLPTRSVHTLLRVTAFQLLIKCLLYRARAWRECLLGQREAGRGNLSFNCFGTLSWGYCTQGWWEQAGSPVLSPVCLNSTCKRLRFLLNKCPL